LAGADSIIINKTAAILLGAFLEKNWRFKSQEHLNELIISGQEYFVVMNPLDKAFVRDNVLNSLALIDYTPIKN
jgi:hypothetical protein